jgi:hypothetical protein
MFFSERGNCPFTVALTGFAAAAALALCPGVPDAPALEVPTPSANIPAAATANHALRFVIAFSLRLHPPQDTPRVPLSQEIGSEKIG